jgi:RNA polymerase sigma-70 factor (ECF subfamily)
MADTAEVWVRRAIRGDRAAFARLYETYSRAVFLDLVARLRRREDAEDALQAAFLAAWTNLPRLTRPSRFVPWLFRIARNKARDLARRERLRIVRPLGEEVDLIAPAGDEPADIGLLKELVAALRADSRAIVLLRAVEGWSAEEVAAARGWSASTVRRKYARAMEHLRAGLARRWNDGRDTRYREAR